MTQEEVDARNGRKVITVYLTEEQVDVLVPLFKTMNEMWDARTPGMLLAHIKYDDRGERMQAFVATSDEALAIQRALGRPVGATTDDDVKMVGSA